MRFILCLSLLLWTLPLRAEMLEFKTVQLNTERDSSGVDIIYSMLGGKRVAEIKLERFPAGPKILKFEKVAKANDYILVDYFKGTSGTTINRECYDVLLIKVSAKGKIFVKQKTEYRCDGDADEVVFHHPYSVEVKAKEVKISTKE